MFLLNPVHTVLNSDARRDDVTEALTVGGRSLREQRVGHLLKRSPCVLRASVVEHAPHRRATRLQSAQEAGVFKQSPHRALMSRAEPSLVARGSCPTDNGVPESEEELNEEQDAEHRRFMRDRRRARSLPSCPAAALLADSGARKRVQFADTLGLSLADVKHFSALEEPRVPHAVLTRHRCFPPPQTHAEPMLLPCFPELVEAELRAKEVGVALEKVHVTPFEVRGQILTRSENEHAAVFVRYTFNEWLSHVDAPAVRVSVGRFTFSVLVPPMWSASAVHLAVFLRSADGECWDNNRGHNYSLRYGRVHGHLPVDN